MMAPNARVSADAHLKTVISQTTQYPRAGNSTTAAYGAPAAPPNPDSGGSRGKLTSANQMAALNQWAVSE